MISWAIQDNQNNNNMKRKIIAIGAVVLLLALIGWGYFKFYFVYSTDTADVGTVFYFKKQGVIFKTYEGELIGNGMRAGMESKTFRFSVEDENVAQQIIANQEKTLQLHSKEYLGTLPWRGESRNIVDSVVVKD